MIVDPTSLINTAKELVYKLNNISESIQKLEDSLQEMNANFPFRHLILTGKSTASKKPEERHQLRGYPVVGYYTRQERYIVWLQDQESKDGRFRLFLLDIEKEFIEFEYDPHQAPADDVFDETTIRKKPLRQTKMHVRLHISSYLNDFVQAFQEYLTECLTPLKANRIASTSEDDFQYQ